MAYKRLDGIFTKPVLWSDDQEEIDHNRWLIYRMILRAVVPSGGAAG